MRIRLVAGYLAALIGLLSAFAAVAQTAPTRLRGTIAAIDVKSATIATREGTSAQVNLNENWVVALVVPVEVSEIKEGSFVGIASLKGADGVLNALEVLVFPEAARGTNEGHYPWDLQPESLMTNATVSTLAKHADGDMLTLTYKGGTQNIRVKPGVPIVTFMPGQQADAKVGAKVVIAATRTAEGALSAGRILVGKDGFTPPPSYGAPAPP